MTGPGHLKFDAAVVECRLHAVVLADAASRLPTRFTAADMALIDSELRRSLDQASYRFMKLQDSLDEKVLPGVLSLTLDPLPPEVPCAEKLQRLERLGVLGSVETWRLLRQVRNALAHDYPDNAALQAAALSRLLKGVSDLLALWAEVERCISERLG